MRDIRHLLDPDFFRQNRKPRGDVKTDYPKPIATHLWDSPKSLEGGTASLVSTIGFLRRGNLACITNNPTNAFGCSLDEALFDNRTELTVVTRIKWNALTIRDGVFGAGGQSRFSLSLGYNTPTKMFMYAGAWSTEFTSAVGAIEVGKWYTFVWRYDAAKAAADRIDLWTNGKKEGPFTWTGTVGATTDFFTFYVGAGDNASNCEVEFFASSAEVWTDQECQRASADPYRLLKPANDRIWIPSNGITSATTGTATASITELDGVTGGKTIILTLTGDTWVADA